ncbi:U3 small nucleolar RNA-associated protein 18 homolog [Dendrobium catenatum]|uniref:U3 small nucleolar RNA-associated protein 18 homolog n=1 Tax=Dendrobium catenatum TaxID=906689 RepID=A0A2I0VLK7_9ASPA|nr:U3 small nucleolar RNA-associated protein 18 homolog [Dendrobium catenatum]PKU64298.1 U3 small nucleolar RNA-associated protein 18 like [Dendrobium catenatum]
MSLISQNTGTKFLENRDADEDVDAGGSSPCKDTVEKEPKLSRFKRSKKRNRTYNKYQKASRMEEEEKEIKKLESFLFGGLNSSIQFGKEIAGDDNERPLPLFFLDKSAGDDMIVYKEDICQDSKERKPVWVDEEEERTEVNILSVRRLRKLRKEADEKLISGAEYVSRLRAQHAKLNPRTDWAEVNQKSGEVFTSDDESNDESGITNAPGYGDAEGDDVLRGNYELIDKSSVKLLPGILEYSRLMNANSEEPSNGPINSVQFHRNGKLLLTAGLDKRLRFFQIDGKRNTSVQSIFMEDFPTRKASFLPNGSHVILSGRRKFFYVFDLVKAAVDKIGPLTGREEKSLELFEVSPDSNTVAFIGNEGYILLVSTKTKELIGTLKMNGTARSLAFVDDGRQLISGGGDGHIYHWDLRLRRCIHKGVDEGCITTTSLSASPDSSLFAAGSSSGIVNIYRRDNFLGGKKKPLKSIENLTTTVNFLKFNQDAQILAICSHMKKDSLKLIHIPSFNVFSNWPPRSGLQYPRCVDFSPGGGFMAIGNAAGKVLLYKLNHYQNA